MYPQTASHPLAVTSKHQRKQRTSFPGCLLAYSSRILNHPPSQGFFPARLNLRYFFGAVNYAAFFSRISTSSWFVRFIYESASSRIALYPQQLVILFRLAVRCSATEVYTSTLGWCSATTSQSVSAARSQSLGATKSSKSRRHEMMRKNNPQPNVCAPLENSCFSSLITPITPHKHPRPVKSSHCHYEVREGVGCNGQQSLPTRNDAQDDFVESKLPASITQKSRICSKSPDLMQKVSMLDNGHNTYESLC